MRPTRVASGGARGTPPVSGLPWHAIDGAADPLTGQPTTRGVTTPAVSVSESGRDPTVAVSGRTADETPEPSGDTIDLRVLGPLAVWTRATQGDPAFRAMCAAADVSPDAFSNGGGRVPVARLAEWLAALRDSSAEWGTNVLPLNAAPLSEVEKTKWTADYRNGVFGNEPIWRE